MPIRIICFDTHKCLCFASIRINTFGNVSGLRMSTFVNVGERQRICCSSEFFNMSKIHRRIYFCARVRFNALIDSHVYVSYTFESTRERFRHLFTYSIQKFAYQTQRCELCTIHYAVMRTFTLFNCFKRIVYNA